MDPIIATQVNHGLKTCASGFARSATECSTPQIRSLLAQASQDAINRQEELTRLMESRGWYVPPMARQEDINEIMPQLQALAAESAKVAQAPMGVR